jgi:jasmonate O-methyltransferase
MHQSIGLLVEYVSKTLCLQAPEHLTRNQIPAYDIDEDARRKRLPMVLEAYAQQFRTDFTVFLKLRAKELVAGGQMVVSLIGRPSYVIASKFFHLWEVVCQILSVMTSEVHSCFIYFSSISLANEHAM